MTDIYFEKITFPQKRPFLNNVTSSIQSNKLTAIIGPSGSGKTTLLKIISGRFTNKYGGNIKYGNKYVKKQEMRKRSVFVHQNDIFLPYLTVEETIEFYETLRDRKHSGNLELDRIMNNYVGTSEKGISAGERKRLSILIGMLDEAKNIFLDEPTSGLDSLNALNMVKVLKGLAGTKVCVLHQPSAEMFFMFDEIIVMHQGTIIYQDMPENVFGWFSLLNLECPKYSNPADYIFTHLLPYIETNNFPTCARQHFTEQERQNEFAELESPDVIDKLRFQKPWISEFFILFNRNLKQIMRNKMIGIAKVLQSVFTALVIALVYYGTYKKELIPRAKNISGVLYIFSMNSLFSSAMSSIPDLYNSQNVLQREYQNRYYRYSTFLGAKILSDTGLNLLPVFTLVPIVLFFCHYDSGLISFFLILFACIVTSLVGHSLAILASAICPSIQIASAALPAFIMPLTLLNGVFLDTKTMSPIFQFLQYISPTRHSFNIMMKTEFEHLPPSIPKDSLVEWYVTIKQSFEALFAIYAVNILAGFFLLRRKINKKI